MRSKYSDLIDIILAYARIMKINYFIQKIKRKSIEIPRNIFLFKIGPVIRYFKKRPLPQNPDGAILIHIGCGEFNDKRYINVDARQGWHIHYAGSVEDCERLFPADFADLIYCCHILEHVSHQKISGTLKGLYKKLKRGGTLRISVPDFNTIVKMYKERNSIEDIIAPLMGGQGYPENFHYNVFDESYLKELLLESGFKEVKKWNPENASYHNFNDWSKRKFSLYEKEWSISLNLEAIK